MKHVFLPISLFTLIACQQGCSGTPSDTNSFQPGASEKISADEARQIAREAYTYFFPMVDAYRIEYAYFVARDNTENRANWNLIQ
jgi:hypothetical protein